MVTAPALVERSSLALVVPAAQAVHVPGVTKVAPLVATEKFSAHNVQPAVAELNEALAQTAASQVVTAPALVLRSPATFMLAALFFAVPEGHAVQVPAVVASAPLAAT